MCVIFGLWGVLCYAQRNILSTCNLCIAWCACLFRYLNDCPVIDPDKVFENQKSRGQAGNSSCVIAGT